MYTAAIDERARLRDLYTLRVLDTIPDERFEQFTQLVADVFDVPFCEIALIDRDYLWMKAATGTGRTKVPRPKSICTHFLNQDLLEIPDTQADPVFAKKDTVTGRLAVRFYAGANLHGPGGQPIGRLCVLDRKTRRLSDSERKRLQSFARLVEQELAFNYHLTRTREDLSEQVLYDPATRLPGRILSEERLEELITVAHRENRPVAAAIVRFLKYDEFIATYGRELLDEVARMFSERALQQVAPHGFVGRLGDDRLLVVMPDFDDTEQARNWARTVYASMIEPYSVGEGRRSESVTVGVSLYPEDANSVSELLRHAMLAGDSGAAGLHFYATGADTHVQRRDRMIARLDAALEKGAIGLVYQPVYRASDGQPLTCEALARWHDPELGQVSPAEFIPVVEANPHFSRLLTRHVLREASRAATLWNDGRSSPISVNINIAGPEFHREDFAEEVEAALAESGLPREQLVIELTEQTVIGNIVEASRLISHLREQGIRFALDDFGTGYSSLAYLRRLPVDTLKIDRSFVRDLPDDRTALELARGIVNIGKALNMSIVAEGVETEGQRHALTEVGCDALQGYLLARPMPLDDLKTMLQ